MKILNRVGDICLLLVFPDRASPATLFDKPNLAFFKGSEHSMTGTLEYDKFSVFSLTSTYFLRQFDYWIVVTHFTRAAN